MSTEVQKEGQRPKYKDYVSFLEAYKNGKRDESDDKPKRSFREHLESYNGKRYGPVQPSFGSTVTKTLEKTSSTTEENKFNRVNSVSKMFEKNSATDSSVTSKVNRFEIQTSNGVDGGEAPEEQRKISIVEISKRFENHSQPTKRNDVEQRVPPKKTNSITEKSKVFESNNRREIEAKKNVFNGGASSLARQKEESRGGRKVENGVPNYPPPQPPKIPTPTRSVSPPKPENSQILPDSSPFQKTEESTPPPPPPPPPMAARPETAPVTSCPPPPPPPPPMAARPESTPVTSCPPPPPLPNGYSTLPRTQNGTRDRVDGIPAPSLDKNDPRVKKLVYGALRDMYGAYHDKANDYLATLPKNRVRKNNGLDSIINSIAAQGGLDKLSGRANPSVDVE